MNNLERARCASRMRSMFGLASKTKQRVCALLLSVPSRCNYPKIRDSANILVHTNSRVYYAQNRTFINLKSHVNLY